MTDRAVIPHIDDLGCAFGVNQAMVELAAAGVVTSGSAMVPTPWFADVVTRMQHLDIGVHLTLTSEAVASRWRPVSTTDRGTGLYDDAGFMWATVPDLRRSADPSAVEAEMRAQVEIAEATELDITHLDHHMGAALAPEWVERTVDIAIDHQLPVAFPDDLDGLFAVLNMGPMDVDAVRRAHRRAATVGVALADRFVMPLTHHETHGEGAWDHGAIIREMLDDVGPGVTYLSLHCAVAGDVEHVHPNDASWRIGEHAALSDASMSDWMPESFDVQGVRSFRDALRRQG